MKKMMLAALMLFLILPRAQSQSRAPIANEKSAVKEGDNTVNIYYGTNVLSAIFKKVASDNAEDLNVKTFGPIGLVYEHLVTNHIGIGAEFGYSKTTISYYETETTTQNNQQTTQRYGFNMQFTTIRAMFRANFHFAESDKFDAYGLISAGYRNTMFSYTTDDPYNTTSLSYNRLIPIPIGIKPGLGMRYFFTPNFGLNLEIALGTPLLCGGISLKF